MAAVKVYYVNSCRLVCSRSNISVIIIICCEIYAGGKNTLPFPFMILLLSHELNSDI